jgi:ariadne-1
VEATVDPMGEALDVFCACGSAFCFSCKEEAHRPVDCDTVRRWLVKNSAESENLTWILANTKPCPKCTRPIEKNQGCMHMTCSQCRFEFCWLCLGAWSEHGERTGGFYNCNAYKQAREKGQIDDAELQRDHARMSLERYMHYWQRWAEHNKARELALVQLAKWEADLLEALGERVATPASQLRFVLDAWREIINSRRVLKWTYTAGFYTFADLEAGASAAERDALGQRKEFFEFNQRQAEGHLEKLTSRVEKDLVGYLKARELESDNLPAPQGWARFREELIGLTDVTRTHFNRLVDFLGKGLEEAMSEFRGEVVYDVSRYYMIYYFIIQFTLHF